MSASGKIRLGAALLIVGEIGGLATQEWARASTFLAFVLGAGVVMVVGAAMATWGIVQDGGRSQEADSETRPPRGEEEPSEARS